MVIANSVPFSLPIGFLRHTWFLRSRRSLHPRFIRLIALLAIREERHPIGVLSWISPGRARRFLLDKASGNPVVCAMVRDELKRMLRSRKACPPGWRNACFGASARRFGPLTG